MNSIRHSISIYHFNIDIPCAYLHYWLQSTYYLYIDIPCSYQRDRHSIFYINILLIYWHTILVSTRIISNNLNKLTDIINETGIDINYALWSPYLIVIFFMNSISFICNSLFIFNYLIILYRNSLYQHIFILELWKIMKFYYPLF